MLCIIVSFFSYFIAGLLGKPLFFEVTINTEGGGREGVPWAVIWKHYSTLQYVKLFVRERDFLCQTI